MSTEPAATSLLRDLAPILRLFGDRWYVFGAQAVVVWGRPRMTADVYVTAFLEPDDPLAFVAAMERESFRLRVADPREFVAKTRVLPFLHMATCLPLDVVLAGPGPEEEFAGAARRLDLGARMRRCQTREFAIARFSMRANAAPLPRDAAAVQVWHGLRFLPRHAR